MTSSGHIHFQLPICHFSWLSLIPADYLCGHIHSSCLSLLPVHFSWNVHAHPISHSSTLSLCGDIHSSCLSLLPVHFSWNVHTHPISHSSSLSLCGDIHSSCLSLLPISPPPRACWINRRRALLSRLWGSFVSFVGFFCLIWGAHLWGSFVSFEGLICEALLSHLRAHLWGSFLSFVRLCGYPHVSYLFLLCLFLPPSESGKSGSFASFGDGTILLFWKIEISFAKEPYKRDYILQKRPVILRSLLIEAPRVW